MGAQVVQAYGSIHDIFCKEAFYGCTIAVEPDTYVAENKDALFRELVWEYCSENKDAFDNNAILYF